VSGDVTSIFHKAVDRFTEVIESMQGSVATFVWADNVY